MSGSSATSETGPSKPPLAWHVTPRPWSYAYEEGDEYVGRALTEVRTELGFASADDFSQWIYETTSGSGSANWPGKDVPPPLIEAAEFPALGNESLTYYIESLAEALNVSPGTMWDEISLRASGRFREDGSEIPEDEQT